ncbi:guanine nucleotide-binding protein alpha-2 subunit [Pisolithus orientalis]|uniref:guanine nucleotide-binding protein alpha-2 subunit n=1 Tax=Pisolithus orientalis TaxID=936130 RepID=UPI002223F601|nr:guanine nucleotide-binding protein alpha-2 subunit [Pisolithus orientalis]KAI5994612.1 guanine nucleotide-binding protein alpha-2 subunit [Pisolithus orientalis]
MGACISTGGMDPEDRRRHLQVEKQLKEVYLVQRQRMASQVKVLLLGSGDSGKSTVLKQMRFIHKIPFSPEETESYRQLVFNNLITGMLYVFDAMEHMELEVAEDNLPCMDVIRNASDLRDHEPFPIMYYDPLKNLWGDKNVQKAYQRGNEAALPENLSYFFPCLDRLFEPSYQPTEQDIVQCRARTIGITETTFHLKDHEMLMVDVGGQKSERRKWIHSLSGYDQCLVEDRDANQMQDAMTIWDSICHSQWFKQTSIILFLNKDDLFRKRVAHSDIKNFFPDYEGEPGDAKAGRDYFRKRFVRLSQKAGRSKEREIYVHTTTATDTAMLRVVMAAVEAPFFAPTSKLRH